jgi:hypothetical protein
VNDVAALTRTQIAQASASLHTHALARDFLATFAQSPQAHLRSWLASQSRDLDIVLGAQIAGAAAGGGAGVGAGIGDEEMRRAETFKGKWVDEAVVSFPCDAHSLADMLTSPLRSCTSQHATPRGCRACRASRHCPSQARLPAWAACRRRAGPAAPAA